MERAWTAAEGEGDRGGDRGRAELARACVLPSRANALRACEDALASGSSLLLLTGEPGIGKTWLWRLLAARETGARGWLGIEAAPSAGPAGLCRAYAHALGLNASGSALGIRLALADHLAVQTSESRRWVAVVDEAHGLSNEQLEELRLLSNRLGEPDGFAAMILAGQTRLARRLATQELAPLEARLSARVHLRPIDADEARDLLEHEYPARTWTVAETEALHRDAGGNPSRLLRLAAQRRQASSRHVRWLGEAPQRPAGPILAPTRADDVNPMEYEPEPEASAEPATILSAPLLGPTRPPILEEEGLIEVGWEPTGAVEGSVDLDSEPAESRGTMSQLASSPEPATESTEPSEEVLEDHYAAVQAWNEWARNQGRRPNGTRDDIASASLDDRPEEELRADGLPPGPGHVWAEGPDSFAPYSQLFSRLRPSKDPD